MKPILSVLFAVLLPCVAFAQDDISTGLPLDQAKWLTSRHTSATVEEKLLRSSSGVTHLNGRSGGQLQNDGTAVLSWDSNSVDAAQDVNMASAKHVVWPAASVITPSTSVPTPAAGNTLSNVNTILAAGAPTAAFVVLPVATASVGKTFRVFNQGSNPLAIVPQTGVINVSAALTPFSCTTLKECECRGLTTGVFGCSQK